jgi:hypothetical protein
VLVPSATTETGQPRATAVRRGRATISCAARARAARSAPCGLGAAVGQLVHSGVIANYAELARLGYVSRARVTQILNLRLLAPDLQEAVLFLPPTVRGHDAIHLRQLQRVAAELDWERQRRLWQALLAKRGSG